jgi:hypothetical protein
VTEVVALVDASRRQARFSRSLEAAFGAAGYDLRPATHRQLVAEVSVTQTEGNGGRVEPDRPLLWLCPGDLDRGTTPDDRFLAAEVYAAARSIAYLTTSPVLNRPSGVSPCGAFPGSSALALRRSRRHGVPQTAVRAERFSACPPDGDGAALEVHDHAAGVSSYGAAPGAQGPFRHREARRSARPAKVRVIGDRAIAPGFVDAPTRATSVRIAAAYALDLALVWWLIDDAGPILARIECWPWDAGFDGDFDAVAEATAAWFRAGGARP